ncbi:hypothetical protein [Rhizobium ruizarguesonis]|uniref:hypothetical protein n=1 Tax=Rhizobium ruizarguesonis TaxID=2081791 RepID=UPI00102FC49C|nr:hypothetical protein [Rhizobium ruizarguesonis]QND41118.1 hypothetical protein HB771_34070 [Rhizobium leguminosarum bv. viciae]TAW02689.1 hypothetical protein ELI25_36495 [Rhizobium ruizarguesonis]TAZ44259.1 hypothetical protein ELH76_35990 [Rhizobium ruizarguesonis]
MDFEPISVTGVVSLGSVDHGSKSERDAVVLRTPEGESYVLRRAGAPSFGDHSMDELVGKRISTTGFAKGSTLIVKEWKVL